MQPHRVFGTLFVASFASAGTIFLPLRDLCLTLYKREVGTCWEVQVKSESCIFIVAILKI